MRIDQSPADAAIPGGYTQLYVANGFPGAKGNDGWLFFHRERGSTGWRQIQNFSWVIISAMNPLNIPELLRRYGLRPDKSLGQNFLIDESALEKVADAAGLQAGAHSNKVSTAANRVSLRIVDFMGFDA